MLYEYECTACGARREHFLKLADRDNPPACESCGGTLKRVLTPPKLHLDGCDPDFPTAARNWEIDRTRRMEREQKTLQSTGDYYAGLRHV